MIRNIEILTCRILATALILFGLWVMVKDGCGGTNDITMWNQPIERQSVIGNLRIDKLTIGKLTVLTNTVSVCTNCVALTKEVERLRAELEKYTKPNLYVINPCVKEGK